MGIEKGRPSEQSPKMKGIFYEAMQEKKLSESPKPLILLFFSKSSVSPLAPYRVFITDLSYEHSIFCFFGFGIIIRYSLLLWTKNSQKVLPDSFFCDKIKLRHNLIFGQTMGEVFFISVKTHSLFWLSLVVCQKLCRSNRSYAFFGA